MNIVTALIECAKDPLAGGYLYGFIALAAGLVLGAPLLALVGFAAMMTALAAGMVIAVAG